MRFIKVDDEPYTLINPLLTLSVRYDERENKTKIRLVDYFIEITGNCTEEFEKINFTEKEQIDDC